MDDRQYRQARKADPGLDTDGLADAPAMQQAIAEADDMPVWLREPVPKAAEGGAFAAFKRAAIFWGASVASLVLVFASAMWLFDEHGSGQPLALDTMAAPLAPAPAAPLPAARDNALPPLVLLTPAPDTAGSAGAPPAVQALKAPEKATPLVAAQLPLRVPPASPVVAKAAPKPAEQPPRKVLLAKSAVAPKAKPAAAKKPVLAAKRVSAPAAGKAKPRLLAAAMLPAPRARGAERETQRAAPAKTHKCLPGELARECAARQ